MSGKKNEGGPEATGAILIADDNQDDIKFMTRDLKRIGLLHPIHSVVNGDQVLCYLKGEGPFGDRGNFPYPILLLLDLRMQPLDGFGVLRWLKDNPLYKTFPVLILTGFGERSVITEAYRLGATTFLTKPLALTALKETVQVLNVLPREVVGI